MRETDHADELARRGKGEQEGAGKHPVKRERELGEPEFALLSGRLMERGKRGGGEYAPEMYETIKGFKEPGAKGKGEHG